MVDDGLFWFQATILGPIRLLLFFLMFSVLYRLTAIKLSNQIGIEFFVPHYVMGMSSAIIGSLVLTQINGFDSMLILMVIVLFYIFSFMHLKRHKPLKRQLQKIYSRFILYMVIKFEKNRPLVEKNNFQKRKSISKEQQKAKFWQIIIAIFLFFSIFYSRYMFLNEDNYLLSSSWFEDLEKVKAISQQNWFSVISDSMGGFAIISLYSKISGLNDMLALSSFGFLEGALLAVILYWVVYKLTGKHGPGLIAAISFGFGYQFIPLNSDAVLQHKSVFLAMTLALPLMVFNLYPTSFRQRKNSFFLWSVIAILAISLIDLLIALGLLLPFFILCYLLNSESKKSYNENSISAYVISLALISLLYGVASYFLDESFIEIFRAKLSSFNYYTYTPKLVLEFSELALYYLIAAAVILGFSRFMMKKNPEKWRGIFIFSILISLLLFAYLLKLPFLDNDLLVQVISVLLPVLIGFSFYVLCLPIRKLRIRTVRHSFEIGLVAFTFIFLVFGNRYSTGSNLKEFDEKKDVFQAYHEVEKNRLPFTYAVVNSDASAPISNGNHYFLSFTEFNNAYLEKDEEFYRFKNEQSYLRSHPEVILPASVFVFFPLNRTSERLGAVQWNIKQLRKRGREITEIFRGETLVVYEIINIPGSSRINDLLL